MKPLFNRLRMRRAEKERARGACGPTVLAYDADGIPIAYDGLYGGYPPASNPERKRKNAPNL